MNPTWKAAIGVILIFVLGWFGGALTTMVIGHHRMMIFVQHDPEQMATLLERQTTRNLGLNDHQKRQFHALLVENLKQRIKLQGTIQPQVRAMNSQTLQQIDAMLSPGQQEKFQENLLRLKRRFGRNPLNAGPDQPAAAPVLGPTNAATGASPAR